MAACTSCGTKLGIGRRISGKSLCENCEQRIAEDSRRAAAARETARNQYVAVARTMVTDPSVLAGLPQLALAAGLSGSELERVNADVYQRTLEMALADERITAEEEASLDWVAQMLDVSPDAITQALMPVHDRFLIARANAGRLLSIPDPAIILKSGEIAHLEVAASLMKEVVHRETRGAYGGYSFRIMRGVSYRTGAYRGKSIVTGTSMEIADQGTLTITSQRAVFKGLRQSVELIYTKLVGVNVFDDGIQFHVSNRKNASLFRVPDGHVVAATVNAAMQK